MVNRILTVVILVLVAASVALGLLWHSARQKNHDLTRQIEQADRTDRATSKIVEEEEEQVTVIKEVEYIVRDSAESYQRGYNDAIRTQPETADWAADPVPDSLRDLARARRLARERSAGAEDGG